MGEHVGLANREKMQQSAYVSARATMTVKLSEPLLPKWLEPDG